MAIDFGVYLAADRVPTVAGWNRAAADLGLRLRMDDETDVATHGGTIPVAHDADEFNTTFEFQLRRDWGRPGGPAGDVLRGRDLFAHFRCFAREWPAAAWAAVAFAKATDGIYADQTGAVVGPFDAAAACVRADLDAHAPAAAAVVRPARDEGPEARERRYLANQAAEAAWARKERPCPKCGTVFRSVGNRGGCPTCGHVFHASHPQGGSPLDD